MEMTCPECGGNLKEVDNDGDIHFECESCDETFEPDELEDDSEDEDEDDAE